MEKNAKDSLTRLLLREAVAMEISSAVFLSNSPSLRRREIQGKIAPRRRILSGKE